jgi:DNA-directed RNA polymerase subunit beta
VASLESDRPPHSARIIPERGSWIEIEVTKKDVLAMRIDQSTKIAATTFLRAIDDQISTTAALIERFYDVSQVTVAKLKPEHYAAEAIVDTDTGEELVGAACQIGEAAGKIQASSLKKVRVVADASDPLILNTIAAEQTDQFIEQGVAETEHEAALLRIYGRLRPGNPPQVDKARQLFNEKFFDENRYRIGKVGRFRINRKFGIDLPETEMRLRAEDFLETIKYILDLRSARNKAHVDDIDHLGNRRLRTLDELAVEEMRKGFLKLRRTVQERMSVKEPDELAKIADLINSKSISSSIEFFFGRGELSQVVDQTNALSQLTHERRLSALGPGGLNRKRAGFEVRDVHISHYGRICPIETPEGTNIGLIASLGIYSKIDDYGFLLTPYQVVNKGKVGKKVQHLRADEEMKAVLGPSDLVDENGQLNKGTVIARVDGELSQVDSKEVEYVDISPKQIVGVSAALIPFLEHDDANRALMGSNMQRQAVPLLRTEPPVVATGMEKDVPKNSGMVVRARNAGTVTSVDARHIVIDNADEYELRKNQGLNEKTCLNQRPIVRLGQKIKAGQIIADGAGTQQGELALGRNVLVAFNTFDGYNFEDAIVINEKLVKDDVFTSVHIEEFDVEIRETKLGREEFTRDIPNVSEKQLAHLDEYGVIQVGTHVQPNDILVGKVSPKSKSELTPEEKLLHAIFGRAGEDVKNDSLDVPAGTEGVVIGTQRFSRRMHMSDEQKKQLKKDMKAYEQDMNAKAIALFRQMVEQVNEVAGTPMVDPSTRQKVGASEIDEVILEQIEGFDTKWIKGSKAAQQQAEQIVNQFWPRIQAVFTERDRKLAHMKRGDELPSGVLEMVKVWLCTKRQLAVGDKFAGRHGNKGVVARIVPEEDMPFLDDGTSVDVLLNPLGVPSRMNVGQILETHLGWAAAVLGFQAVTPVFDGATEAEVHAAIDEANDYIHTRRRELLGLTQKDPSLTDDATKAGLLARGFNEWLPYVKWVPIDGEKFNDADMELLETALLFAFSDPEPRFYKDESYAEYLPRFNAAWWNKKRFGNDPRHVRTRVQAEIATNEDLAAVLRECTRAIEDVEGWRFCGNCPVDADARKNLLSQVGKKPGFYFFASHKRGGDGVREGYIGKVGPTSSTDLRDRLDDHFGDKHAEPAPQLDNLPTAFWREEQHRRTGGALGPCAPHELLVQMPRGGKVQLYDGRTGEPFDQRTTVGYMYLMKLHHLVDDKIHARATGPYSLITQQPLGGKARTGGQRFGEMEVWALEAYGAAYVLQELLTVKSDDVEGRTKIYESMVKGAHTLEAGMPVAFDVLCNEIKGLGLNISMEKKALEGGSLL